MKQMQILAEFKRKFSLSTYKNLKINLARMTFYKDFINDTRGDLYPIKEKSTDAVERVCYNQYLVERGKVSRMVCQFFPFASYEVSFSQLKGEVGFIFSLAKEDVFLTIRENFVYFSHKDRQEKIEIPSGFLGDENTLIVSCRPSAFDVYLKINGKPEFLSTIYEQAFDNSNEENTFKEGYVFLSVSGKVTIKEVLSYIDSGVGIADIRPVKYEDGEVLCDNGRVYLTASIRMQEGTFQGVFSWLCGTVEIDLTGVVFYDTGDGKWRNYVAPVMIYDRNAKEWIVWVSGFEHTQMLAYANFKHDVRFGVNVIDVKGMEGVKEGEDISQFLGFIGDEDPDLIYEEENSRWILAVCRIDPKTDAYMYVFFESDNPFSGFKYIGKGFDGAETGGSFVKINGELHFVCGNSFERKSEYRIYDKNGMKTAKFNYPDGGFRGWGSLFSVNKGSRTKYYWLTFDRHNGSKYNWSYGNLYCFEG